MKKLIQIASSQLNKIAAENINTATISQKYVQRSNFLAFFVMALVPIFIPIFFYVGAPLQAAALLAIFFNSYYVTVLNRKYDNKSGRVLQMFSLLGWLFYLSLIFGRASSAHYLYLAFALVPFAQFHRKDTYIPLLSIISFLIAFWAIEFKWVEISPVLSVDEQENLHKIVVTLVFVWAATSIWYYNRTSEVYEEAIREALKKVDQKNKEMEQFVYIASHDLQEPVRSIDSFARMCLEENDKTVEDEKLYLNYIISSAGRMNEQIKALMNHSRIGVGETLEKRVDVSEIIQNVQQDLSEAIARTKAEVQYDYLPKVVGYPMGLHLLFLNLISNSLKFSKKDEAPVIRIEGKKLDEKWEFSLSDNGIGIDPMHHEKVFAIFQRLNPRKKFSGQGIGLAHCKKIVELHRGDIWFKSKPGEGTTFYFTLSKEKNELA